MIKKMISLLCVLSAVGTFIQGTLVYAENTGVDKNAQMVLQALGIDDASAYGVATNDYFISALSGFLYDEDSKPADEVFARSIGAIKYGEAYDGTKSITKDEALEYAVATLGYREYAESFGKNGIRDVAATLGLIKGMDVSGNEVISVDECRVLLYNMLEVEPMAIIFSEGQKKNIIVNDQTLLSNYRDVHEVRGVLTSDGITSLDGEESGAEGYIEIDNSLQLIANDISVSELLGKNIEAYVKRDNKDELTVLYIGERTGENKELIIDSKDIDKMSSDYSKLEYFENNRLKSAKIADAPSVIYNGVFYGDYKASDFEPALGNIRLVDNDNDNKYDVIFINSYETIIVDGVDRNRKLIYSKFKTEGMDIIDLDTDTSDITYTISNEYGALDIDDIKKGDVLTVAKSKAAVNVVINILVSGEFVEGKLYAVDENKMEISIEGEIYPIADSFLRFRNEENNIALGNTYKFFIDSFGYVAYWTKINEDGYAAVAKVWFDETTERVNASYMNLEGKWIDTQVAEKVKINGTLYKDEEVICSTLKAQTGTVMKLAFNSVGEINTVETATETGKADKNIFTKTPYQQYTWRSGPKAFSDSTRYKYFLDDGAKLLVIGSDVMEREGYYVRSAADFFKSDTNYRVSLYDVDEFGFTSLVVIEYEPIIRDSLFVVTNQGLALDEGEARSMVEGYVGEFMNVTLMGKDAETFDNVVKGDIIAVSMNPEGYVDKYETIFRLSDMTNENGNYHMGGTQYTSRAYLAGDVVAVDAGRNRLLINVNGTEYGQRIGDSTGVHMYSPENGLEKASIHDIMLGDKIFIHSGWGEVKQIIIHE